MNRSLQSRIAGAAAASLVLLGGIGQLQARQTYGLVVGIDKYIHAPLNGAVNDALDIADALKSRGVDVTLLIDDAAHRDAIFAAWKAIVAKAAPGDLIVFSYAGHGGQEPEAIPGSEEDGKDETFLLGGFTEGPPGNGQRIRDDEINELLLQASAQTVLFVADSCHSGTMTRSVSRQIKAGSRFMDYGAIVADTLPPPVSAAKSVNGDLDHVLFFAGVADHLEVMEVTVDGKKRGALSYAVARGLRGEADQDGDGGISRSELTAFVRATMLSVTNGRQQVQVEGTGRRDDLIVPKPFMLALAKSEGIDLAVVQAGLPAHVRATTDATESADLTWDMAEGVMIDSIGAIVATLSPSTGGGAQAPVKATRSVVRAGSGKEFAPDWRASLPAANGVVAKYTLVERLSGSIAKRPLSVTITPQANLHHKSDKITLDVLLPQERFLTMFNIGPAGDINFLYPLAAYKDQPSLPDGHKYSVDADVHSPFGAEHFVAVASREQPLHLQKLLQQLDRRILSAETVKQLAAEIHASGGRIGLIQAVTEDAPKL
jgi:hypothetical protein